MRFHVFDWEAEDVCEGDLPDDLVRPRSRPDKSAPDRLVYAVTMYGRDAEGRSAAVRMTRFMPYFYIGFEGCHRLDGAQTAASVMRNIERLVSREVYHEVRSARIKQKTEFFGFSAGAKRDYVIVKFDSLRAMRRTAAALRTADKMWTGNNVRRKIVLYETRIEPLSRLIHANELNSAGWVSVDESAAEAGSWSTADACLTVSYDAVAPVDEDGVAPAVISAFDIECTSSSGDFPVAVKSYRKIANNLRDVLALAAEHGGTRSCKRELARATVLLSLGAQVADPATAEAVEWITERSPAAVTRRLLGLAETKRQMGAPEILAAFDPLLDDVVNYATHDIRYADASRPQTAVDQIETALRGAMPELKGDPIIQIGVTSNRVGSRCFRKWICTLGTCAAVAGAEVEQCATERALITAFARHVREVDPDVMTGYNIYGFDMKYIHERAREVGAVDELMKTIGRRTDAPARFVEKRLSSSALGDNVFWLIETPGRVMVDLMKVVMRDHRLESYKLDNVAHHFTGEKKRDVSPKDIFRLQAGDENDRAIIADYCVQDCELCNSLLEKLRVLINAMAMATTSRVPMSYIFLRGQGVKILSLVSYYCRRRETIVRDLPKPPRALADDAPDWMVRRHAEEASAAAEEGEDDVEVQGAIVLEPDTGFYVDDPVAVCDYASLYPSSILSHGLSPDARVIDDRYRGAQGYDFIDVSYDLYEGEGNARRVSGQETVTFAKRQDANVYDPDTLSIIPAVERILLSARSSTRKKMKHKRAVLSDGRVLVGEVTRTGAGTIAVGGVEVDESALAEPLRDEYGEFMKAVLDGQQLSYKLLANSVYGQLGAKTSDIRDPKVAACVTSVGRGMITSARDYIHANGGRVVYGDTDSVFFTVPVVGDDGRRLVGRDALPLVIRRAAEIGRGFTENHLAPPHDLEYEKTFWPLLLLAKKKYVGNMYERKVDEFSLKYMGIVLKRRDNAPIVRKVMSALLDRLLNNLDVRGAIDNMLEVIDRVVEGRVPIEDLVITKTLKQEYKDKSRVAHAVLAQRMGARDPGNAPQVNDRIPMVHIRVKEKALQGGKVEVPEYVLANNLEVDYQYYLEDQIMNPALQVLSAIVEQIPAYNKPSGYWDARRQAIKKKLEGACGSEETLRKRTRETLDRERQAEAKRLVFDPKISRLRNKYARQSELTSFGFFAR